MNANVSDNQQPEKRLDLFRNPAFRAVWLAGAVASTTRWLEMLAIGVYVFDVTGSPLWVGVMTIMRMLPLALFGAVAGALAERFDRRRFLLLGTVIMLLTSMILAWLVYSNRIQLWHLGLGSFLNGLFWTTDMPARRTLLGEIAGPLRVGVAMGFDSVTSNGTRMLGPLLGGLLLETLGLDGAFAVSTLLYLIGLIATVKLRISDEKAHNVIKLRIFSSIGAGIHGIKSNRPLIGTLVVTVIFNLWGFPFVSMVPVIGKEVLHLSPFPVGLLASAEGAGAVAGAVLIAFFSQPRYYRKLYLYGTLFYLVMILFFAQAPQPGLAALLLICIGLGGAAFSAMQSTLVFLSAPVEQRRRIMGVLSVCIGTGPIGFFHVGLLADHLGAQLAITIMALEGLVALCIAAYVWPEIHQ